MAQIIWTELAFNDLDVIHDFIARESTVYAQSTIESLFQRVEVLASFPKSGRTVPEYSRKDIRELLEGNYRIFYKIRNEKIFILRVHHSARKINTNVHLNNLHIQPLKCSSRGKLRKATPIIGTLKSRRASWLSTTE